MIFELIGCAAPSGRVNLDSLRLWTAGGLLLLLPILRLPRASLAAPASGIVRPYSDPISLLAKRLERPRRVAGGCWNWPRLSGILAAKFSAASILSMEIRSALTNGESFDTDSGATEPDATAATADGGMPVADIADERLVGLPTVGACKTDGSPTPPIVGWLGRLGRAGMRSAAGAGAGASGGSLAGG